MRSMTGPEARPVFIASDRGFVEAYLAHSGDGEPVLSFAVSVVELRALRATARERGEGQEAALLAFADAMVASNLARDEMLWELAEAHWPEDLEDEIEPPPGGAAAHSELMARLEVHVSAAMLRKAFDIARERFAEFAGEDGGPADGALPCWEVERVAEAVAWAIDIQNPTTVVEALKQAAVAEGLEIGSKGERNALLRAKHAHEEWWPHRGYFFSEEAESGRAREDAWSRAFDRAEEMFGEGAPVSAVAAKVAVEIAGLDVDGVADAVVTAAHAASVAAQDAARTAAEAAGLDGLGVADAVAAAGIKLREGAYAEAQAAATAVRWGTELKPPAVSAAPYLVALDAAPSILEAALSGDLPGVLVERFGLAAEEAGEIAAAVIAGAEARAKGLRSYLAKRARAGSPARSEAGDAIEAANTALRVEILRDAAPKMETPAMGAPAINPPAEPHTGPRELPFNLATEPGLLGDLARWYRTMAFRPIDSFAPFAALATVAPLFGRRYATPTGQGLNLYMIGLAETGAGKEALLKAPQSALDAAGLDWLLGAVDFTSDSALEVALRSRPNFLAPIDEVGEFIGGAQHKQAAPHSRTLRKALLDLYGKSEVGSRWSGKQKADVEFDKASSPIYCPTLTILGCATPEGFYASLTEGNMADGFMNRLTVVRGSRPGAPNLDPSRLAVPPSIVEKLRAAHEVGQSNGGNLAPLAARSASTRVSPKVVPWEDSSASSAWMMVLDWEIAANDSGRGGVTARASSNTLKIATLRALCRDASSPAVATDDVAWAWSFVRASIAEIERGAKENMAGSDYEALVKAMERAIAKGGAAGIVMSDLKRAAGVSKATPALREIALKDLVEMGRAHQWMASPPGGGRPSMRVMAGRAPGTE